MSGSRAGSGEMRSSRAGSGGMRSSRTGSEGMRSSRAGSGEMRSSRTGSEGMRSRMSSGKMNVGGAMRGRRIADGRMSSAERLEGQKGNLGKRLCTVLTLALCACLLTGCRLALEEAEAACREEDRLVGVFVTEEHLDSGTPELKVNSRGEVSFAESGERIDGRIVSDENGVREIVFDGTEGCGIYNIKVWEEAQQSYTSYGIGDDIFSDVYWATNSSDISETNTVEATIYVEPGGPAGLYFNPVYQTARGDIYMQPGSGLFSSIRSAGESMTHSVSWKRKTVESGQEMAEESSFAIKISYVDRIASYRLLFMGEDSGITEVMTGDELAEMWENGQWELRIPAGTAYLILEQEESGGDILRSVCNRGEGTLEFLRGVGGGHMAKQQMSILWE